MVTLESHRYNLPDNRELACDECAAKWKANAGNSSSMWGITVEPLNVEPVLTEIIDRVERQRRNNVPLSRS
jgi:hypothetical protein